MLSVQEARFSVFAEVGGLATAGGCQLVAACDLAVAAESATFATPGVKIGLFCSTPGAALVRAMPVKHAKESGHSLIATLGGNKVGPVIAITGRDNRT